MSMCCSPGCTRHDEGNDRQLNFERSDDDTWYVVCDRHASDDRPTITLTDDVKEIPVGTLTQIVADLS